jgi:DNA-binding protein WhiA
MSFSSEVKEELSRQISTSRHCGLAELAVILGFLGHLEKNTQGESLLVYTENIGLAKKYFTLIKKIFGIQAEVSVQENRRLHKNRTCMIMVKDTQKTERILRAIKWIGQDGKSIRQEALVDGVLIKNACCRRSFLRGAFLAAGSMSDPEKSYHFEITCSKIEQAKQLVEIMKSFTLLAKIVRRKKYFVVYFKEGAQIVDVLNVMEAHTALLRLENVRIVKEMRNFVNRQVNCETANISKTVHAAIAQVKDIKFIEQTTGLSYLSDGLREMAKLRLLYPEMPLKELGTLLNPPVGKSGVNHRLRKLSHIAQELRRGSEVQT